MWRLGWRRVSPKRPLGLRSGGVKTLYVRNWREGVIGWRLLLAQSKWGGWLLLTASECQSVEAIKQPRAKGAIRDAGYYNRP